MQAAFLSLLISHILTFLESELAKQEPALMAALIADVQSLVKKLESMIATKSPSVAAVVNPMLDSVSHVAGDALQAAGNVVQASLSTPQSVE